MKDSPEPTTFAERWWPVALGGLGALGVVALVTAVARVRRPEPAATTPPGLRLDPTTQEDTFMNYGPFGIRLAEPLTGTDFVARLEGLDLRAREAAIVDAVNAGHVPAAFTQYVMLEVRARGMVGTFWAAPAHLCVGTDEDPFHTPLSAPAAQRVCDHYGQFLPTRRMVDVIHASAAAIHLPFRSFPPSPPPGAHRALSTYVASSQSIERERAGRWGLLDAYAKDYVLTPRRRGHEDRIAIYGAWDRQGTLVQPFALPHDTGHVDYSQKPRLIWPRVLVDGSEVALSEALARAETAHLFSDEGAIPPELQRYPT